MSEYNVLCWRLTAKHCSLDQLVTLLSVCKITNKAVCEAKEVWLSFSENCQSTGKTITLDTAQSIVLDKYFCLTRFWNRGCTVAEPLEFPKDSAICTHSMMNENIVVIHRRDARMGNDNSKQAEDVFVLIDIPSKKIRKVSVPQIEEVQKTLGALYSIRHDPPHFRYFGTRHFVPKQSEAFFQVIKPLKMEGEIEFKYLGNITDVNFAAGYDFVTGSDGEDYIVGESLGELVAIKIKTLQIVTRAKLNSNRSNIYDCIGNGTIGVFNSDSIKIMDVPSLQIRYSVIENSTGGFYNGKSVREYFTERYFLAHGGDLIRLDYGTSTSYGHVDTIPDCDSSAMYSPTLLASDEKYVMWAQWPTGNVIIMNRKTRETKVLIKGTWKKKEYYDITFSGSMIIWHNINRNRIKYATLSSTPEKKKKTLFG